ncbi:MAG TPA: efflux RND transporter permease subunit [Polyangiaceae bacterium]|nr:efflux RND transporter permease subunit [Polyangiaceae bacterium]
MITAIVAFCTRRSGVALALALMLAALGVLAQRRLATDVVPDLADPQIVLIATWMGHPATEVASDVTRVLTDSLTGVPGTTAVRGVSMSGMAYIDVVFDSLSRLEAGREALQLRLSSVAAKLPPNVRLEVGPTATSTGWVYQYALVDPARGQSALALRKLQRTRLEPALAAIPGVAEVASLGGDAQQVVVDVVPEELRKRGLAYTDLLAPLRSALASHAARDPRSIEALPVPLPGTKNQAVTLGELSHVRTTHDMPNGLADIGGSYQAVGGIVIARRDANLRSVIEQVSRVLERERKQLPPNVKIITVYDRGVLAARVEHTLFRALLEEIAVVALVILVFLMHGRSALLPLASLPLVLLLTFAMMWLLGVPATVMSLGGIGIALGLAVDADVVALEACHRRLEEPAAEARDRRANLIAAAGSFTPAILTSLSIAALSFTPVFAFGGETGRLIFPLAMTKTIMIAAAGLVALTVAPALRERLLRGRVVGEFENPITRGLVSAYRPFVHFALTRPTLTLATATLAVASCLPIAAHLGGEFMPRIDEGDLLFMPTTLSGVPPEDALSALRRQDRAISDFPQVATVFGKVGRADTATDPAPYSMAETIVQLRPRSEWPKVTRTRWYSGFAPHWLRGPLQLIWPEQSPATTGELVEHLDRATRLPGWTNAWTSPIRARMDMMSTGIRTAVGIRLVAPDHERLSALGAELRAFVLTIPGTRSAVFESLGGERRLSFDLLPSALAAHDVDPKLARATVDQQLAGGQIGELELDGERRPVRITPDMGIRGPADQIREVTIRAGAQGTGGPVPLALLGKAQFVDTPAMIRTENGALCGYLYVDLEPGADLQTYVERAQRAVDRALAAGATASLHLAPNERIEWAGQYALFKAGARRLAWIVPLVGLAMLGLLYWLFLSFTEALIVLVSVPFALVGSIWTLYLAGYPLSAPVWVGLLAVAGLAMQTGVVMVLYIDEAFHRRLRQGRIQSRADIVAAHAEGTVLRLRPKLMTITTMAASLLPLLWANGPGAEVMRRVAAPMLGGLASSAFLTLEVLPVLYTVWRTRQLRQAKLLNVPLEQIVGPPPTWARPEQPNGSEGAAAAQTRTDPR